MTMQGGISSSRHGGLRPFTTACAGFLAGESSPRHFLEDCLEAIATLDGAVKAFVSLDLDTARRTADDASVRYRANRLRSAIDGMPFGIKDVIETSFLPTQMNSPLYKGFQPRRSAACVGMLLEAGAVPVGKTATAEFACGRSPETRNPLALDRTPGGSSSGSAASVAAGMVPMALGTQTQASVIRPASYCGVYGYKPSFGLVPTDGVTPLSHTLDHVGWLAASLDDLRASATVLVAGFAGDAMPGRVASTLRLAVLETAGWKETDGETRSAFDQAVGLLRRHGVEVVTAGYDARLKSIDSGIVETTADSATLYAFEAQNQLATYAAAGEAILGERARELIAIGRRTDTTSTDDLLRRRAALSSEIAALAGTVDGFMTLSASGPAERDIAYTGSRSFGVPATMLGLPSVSLPLLSSGGLPLGLQLIGFYNGDSKLFSLAKTLGDLLLGETAA